MEIKDIDEEYMIFLNSILLKSEYKILEDILKEIKKKKSVTFEEVEDFFWDRVRIRGGHVVRLILEDIELRRFLEIFKLRKIPKQVIKLKKLKYLNLRFNEVSNLEILKDLKNLKKLYLCDNKISDITPLQDLVNLEVLDLPRNNISDITPLRNLKNLKELDLRLNKIFDITPCKT